MAEVDVAAAAALAAAAPAPPTCSTCGDKGTVYVRAGAIEWEPEDCPDCLAAPAPPTGPGATL